MESVLGIDGVGAKHGGAASVLAAIVRAAMASEAFKRVVVWCSPLASGGLDLPHSPKLQVLERTRREDVPLGRVLWHLRGLAVAATQERVTKMLCVSGGGIAPRRVPCITFIQQSLPFSAEALATLRPASRFRMTVIRRDMELSAWRSALVCVQTPTMKEWLVKAFRLAPNKVESFLAAPDLSPSRNPVESHLSARPLTLLYVGNDSPYKNLSTLMLAFALIRGRHPGARLLVTLPASHRLCRTEGVVGVGYLDRAALAALYRKADVLVMPSLVETVGLPMLEAAAFGIPIVASNRGYAHDVCGEHALFFDPHSPAELASKVEMLIRDPVLRLLLSGAGEARVRDLAKVDGYGQMLKRIAEV